MISGVHEYIVGDLALFLETTRPAMVTRLSVDILINVHGVEGSSSTMH